MESIRQVISRTWNSLAAGAPGGREWRALRIETRHPLDVFAAIRERDNIRGILFECPVELSLNWRLRFDSEGICLFDERESRDGIRRVALVLERPDLEQIFLVVLDDLIHSSRFGATVEEAMSAVAERLLAWQTCLRLRRAGFGAEQELGLYGELMVLERLATVAGYARAVEVWTGPDRGLHDFETSARAIEVKTSHGKHATVNIGALDQLDATKVQSLVLCRIVVVPDDGGVDLKSLIKRVRCAADLAGLAVRSNLDRRLLLSGYIDPDERDAHSDRFSVTDLEVYNIEGDFPRLTHENVNPAITSVTYRIDLQNLSQYRISGSELEKMFTEFSMRQ